MRSYYYLAALVLVTVISTSCAIYRDREFIPLDEGSINVIGGWEASITCFAYRGSWGADPVSDHTFTIDLYLENVGSNKDIEAHIKTFRLLYGKGLEKEIIFTDLKINEKSPTEHISISNGWNTIIPKEIKNITIISEIEFRDSKGNINLKKISIPMKRREKSSVFIKMV